MKNLFLMSQSGLESYLKAKAESLKRSETMSAEDIEANTELVVQGPLINAVTRDGDVEFSTDAQGIAHIPIVGMLKNNIDFMSVIGAALFGRATTTYGFITEATKQAESDPEVKGIQYEIDSGGGDVVGIEAASNAIFSAKKPTQAIIHSEAASGGYWLGCQADKLIAVGKTTLLGSIGVAGEFMDETAAEAAEGVQRVILTSTSAPKKRFDIKSESGQQIVVELMDEMHAIFVEHIVRGRSKQVKGITPDFVNKKFGQGGTMGAEKALKNKMIDGILGAGSASGDGRMAASANNQSLDNPGADPVIFNTDNQEENMTFEEFLAQNPEEKTRIETWLAASAGPDLTALSLVDVLALAPVAQTEHDQSLVDAKTEVEAGKLTAAAVKSVGAIIGSSAYGASIKAAGIKVLTGEKDHGNFEDLVALADEQNEKIKSLQIAGGQPPATPGDPGVTVTQAAQAKTVAAAKALSDEINNSENKVK